MADIDYRDLLWEIRAELPGAPEPLVFFHYAEAVREFFRQSKAWQYNSPSALDLNLSTAFPTISAGTEIPANTYVVEPTSIKWSDGQKILFKTRDQMDLIDADWEQATGTKSKYWTITAPGAWRLYPLLTANQTGILYMRFAIAPTMTTASPRTSIPEELAYEWKQVWTHGALSRLMKIPGKDWSSVNLAAQYGNLFAQGIKEAKSRAAADYGRPDRSVQYGGLGIGGGYAGTRTSDDYGS